MIVLIDNYDSFTYNLVQYIKQLELEVAVVRNDAITVEQLTEMRPSAILISPGPGKPDEAGISLEIVRRLYKQVPILGVCLGHQTIAQAFGASIVKADEPMHGKVSMIRHDGKGMFADLNNPLQVTRYHSLLVDPSTLPDCLEISADTDQGEIMAIRHKLYPIEGIQAHPEAILTAGGIQLLQNFFRKREVKLHVR